MIIVSRFKWKHFHPSVIIFFLKKGSILERKNPRNAESSWSSHPAATHWFSKPILFIASQVRQAIPVDYSALT